MEFSIFYNYRLKRTYGLHANIFYEHVDGNEWVEVPSAISPFRELEKDVFGALFDSFERFIVSTR